MQKHQNIFSIVLQFSHVDKWIFLNISCSWRIYAGFWIVLDKYRVYIPTLQLTEYECIICFTCMGIETQPLNSQDV